MIPESRGVRPSTSRVLVRLSYGPTPSTCSPGSRPTGCGTRA